jgi:hypothetical protein
MLVSQIAGERQWLVAPAGRPVGVQPGIPQADPVDSPTHERLGHHPIR